VKGLVIHNRNGVGAAIEVNGIAVPLDSFVCGTAPDRGQYTLRPEAELNDIPLSPRSLQLLTLPISALMAGAHNGRA
jgi:hypothetical protein